MEHRKIGFAFCGSFCTYSQAMEVLERVQSRYGDVLPIVSEAGAATDTRFRGGPRLYAGDGAHLRPEGGGQHRQGRAHWAQASAGCAGHLSLHGQHPGQAGKRRHGHHGYHGGQGSPAQRGPVVLCPATNDGLAASARNIGVLLDKKNVYFVPSGRTIPPGSPPPWWPTFPWSQPLSTRRWRAASSSPCCLDRRRWIKNTAPGVAGAVCFVIVYRVLAKSMGI